MEELDLEDLTMEENGMVYGVSKMAVSKRLRKLHEELLDSVNMTGSRKFF